MGICIISFLAGFCFFSVEPERKKIALTFDDGPHSKYTEQLLDGLAKRNAKVTFFVTGAHAEENPKLILRMQQEGHLIGNHTYSHIQLNGCNREEYKRELLKTAEVVEQITGETVSFVRPPYGIWDKTLEKELLMLPVFWNVDPKDWCCDNADTIVQRIVSQAEEGDIILMHDYYASSVEAALRIVDVLQEKGFVFVTVDELLME